jgi:hypothetical protein
MHSPQFRNKHNKKEPKNQRTFPLTATPKVRLNERKDMLLCRETLLLSCAVFHDRINGYLKYLESERPAFHCKST